MPTADVSSPVSSQALRADNGIPRTDAWLWHGRVPSLDGLRAVSILGVLVCHAAWEYPNKFPGPSWTIAVEGTIGVDVFFIISGFLITLLMLRERDRMGSISLKSFYERRIFRIVPAYLAFCLTIFLLTQWSAAPFPLRKWVAPLIYMTDFYPSTTPWILAHTWSLSVEEHFYLVWPVLMYFAPRKAPWAALGCIASAPLIRFLASHFHAHWIDLEHCTLTRWDSIAMGCWLAFAMTRGWTDFLRPIVGRSLVLFVITVFAILALNLFAIPAPGTRWGIVYSNVVRQTVTDLCLAFVVWMTLEYSGGLVGRLLNSSPFVMVGWLSYSLYLWQQVFFIPRQFMSINRWPINLILIPIPAVLSYLLIERPFLGFRARLERKRLGEAPLAAAPAAA